jgi:hypothetical protein
VVRIAAWEQDDIAATHALDVRIAVDPKREFALFNDVQGADIGEADRESPQRSVRNDPFSAQTDAPEQLREQVVRLAICVEAERGVLERWRIGKLSRRSEQIGWRRWTIGKMFRRSGHCPYAFLGLRSTNSEWSDQSDGLGTRLGVNFFHWRSSRAVGSSPDILVQVWVRSLASNLSHRTDVTRREGNRTHDLDS